jgi:hypothetical protein
MDAGRGEGFIGVNIAEPGDGRLIQKEILDWPAAGLEEAKELGGGEVKGLDAEAGVSGVAGEPPDLAEAAGVTEMEFNLTVWTVKQEDNVGMAGAGRAGRVVSEAAGHSEVDEKTHAVIEGEDHAFAAAMDLLDGPADQQVGQGYSGRLGEGWEGDLDPGNARTQSGGENAVHDGLNFG